MEIQLRKPATRSAEIETCRALATLPEPGGWAGRGPARGDRSWTAGRGSDKAGAGALPPPCLVDLLFKKRWPCNSSVPTWGNREGLCPADISGRAKAGSRDRRIIRAPGGGCAGPWGFWKANDAEINPVVKVTYIVQRVGSRVDAIGQQAGDALKIKAERGLWTRRVPCCSVPRQSCPGTVATAESFHRANHTWLHRAPATFLGRPPQVRPDDTHMLDWQNQKDTQETPRGSYVWKEGGTPNRQFTNDPACLRASLQIRRMISSG